MAIDRNKLIFTLGKALISLCLLTFLLSRIDTQVFLNLGKQFSIWFFLPLILLFISTTFLGSWRWKLILACNSLIQSIPRGAYLYLVGYFYNNFLPTAIGGDIMRGYEATRKLGSPYKVFSSIVVERIMGLLAALTIALFFLLIVQPPKPLWLLVLGLNAAAWVGTLLLIMPRKTSMTDRFLHRLPAAVQSKLIGIVTAIREYRNNPSLLGKSFLVAILYQGSLILVCWTGAHLAGIKAIPMLGYFVFVPIVWVVALLPISLNALGVNEVSFAYFFSLLGAPKEQGILVSLILFGTTLMSSTVGGVLWGIASYGHGQEEVGLAEFDHGIGASKGSRAADDEASTSLSESGSYRQAR
jgi:hypothetical protein